MAFGYPCKRPTGECQLKFSENLTFSKVFMVDLCASPSPEMKKKECFWEFKIPLFHRSCVPFWKIGVAQWVGCKLVDSKALRINESVLAWRENLWRRLDKGKGKLVKADSLTHSFTHSLTHSFAHSLTASFSAVKGSRDWGFSFSGAWQLLLPCSSCQAPSECSKCAGAFNSQKLF